ncbi:nicotinamide mononucleotide adenylyl transferase 1 [Coccidioides immitis H538.4]|uniref:Nicotinamide-nucleotide adenylyltransferase n=1 Tax=Coccidioides immitis H538.4 TaxID=396776 RepID=A0A0J8RGP3_COCIT|nr:nicotinamide mononucleotide adenylyl transferase 1 [Coccidioides immitis H538.4]
MTGQHDDPNRPFNSVDDTPPQERLSSYSFPDDRLKKVMDNPGKTPLLLVACGSFSPITYLHLRMFEMAADYVKFSTKFELIGGYLSPVSDAYRKAGLASARHRIAMCQLAVDQTRIGSWLNPWEALQKDYSQRRRFWIILTRDKYRSWWNRYWRWHSQATGADLIHTMSTPGVWSEEDLDHILGRYGTFIVERSGTDIDEAIAGLLPWKDNIYVIQQLIQNDVSSTKIRLFLRREMSVRYLIPGPVIDYIVEHHLYEEDSGTGVSSAVQDKLGEKVDARYQSKAKTSASD